MQDAEGFTPADPEPRMFYRELRPISDDFVAEALAVDGRGLRVERLRPVLGVVGRS
ncbi:hypothetical protein [Streptomyces sp. NPDC007264]|uniref:hypothetical protein n=1 Tax=Streptomyces sp. NPDC007264 TaxID=3364777 RepID=UPI0036DE2CE9